MSSDFDFPTAGSRKSVPANKKTATSPVEVEVPTSNISSGENKVEATDAPEYTEEELLQVFDEILFSNEYTEDFVVKNRLKLTFRTRTTSEIQAIDKALDGMGASLISTVEGMRAIMHLESALVNYQGKDLSSMKSTDRSAFIGKLPGAVIGVLMSVLAKFDRKIALACQVGEANF